MPTHFFITGTDTNVGKTYVTAALVRALRARGVDAVGFKPLCCGSRDDAEILHVASGRALSLNEVNPVWLRAPAAPYAAALIENRSIDLDLIRETFATLCERHESVLVEGVGGWLVPIRRDFSTADLAMEWRLPVIIVAANRLGVLNHAALTLGAIRAAGLTCAGLTLNNKPSQGDPGVTNDGETVACATNRGVLEDWLQTPLLAEIGPDDVDLSRVVSKSPFL